MVPAQRINQEQPYLESHSRGVTFTLLLASASMLNTQVGDAIATPWTTRMMHERISDALTRLGLMLLRLWYGASIRTLIPICRMVARNLNTKIMVMAHFRILMLFRSRINDMSKCKALTGVQGVGALPTSTRLCLISS